MKIKLYILLIFFLPLKLIGQLNTDSLWQVWKNKTQHDTNRLNSLHSYLWEKYIYSNTDSAFLLAQIQYEFAKKAKVYNHIGKALNTQGITHMIKGDIKKSNYYLFKSRDVFAKYKIKKGLGMVYNNIGLNYMDMGNSGEAIEYFTKSMKLKIQTGDSLNIASTLNNIGIIYRDMDDIESSIAYFKRSILLDSINNNIVGMAYSVNNVGLMLKEKNQFDLALKYYQTAFDLHKKVGNKKGMSQVTTNIAVLYKRLGQLVKSKEMLLKGLKDDEAFENIQGIANKLINLGSIYEIEKKYTEGIRAGERALKLAKESDALQEYSAAAKLLWLCYENSGNSGSALKMYEIYIETRDSISNQQKQKSIIQNIFKYEYEKKTIADSVSSAKEKKIKNAEIAQQKAELKVKKTQQNFLFGGILLVIILSFYIFKQIKATAKQKNIIEEQKMHIEEKQKEILDSIHYARRIQRALLPSEKYMIKHTKNISNNY